MPMKSKKAYKKRPYRKRKVGIVRSVNPRYQVATVVETFDPQTSFLDNTAINQLTSLSMFKRCILMSRLYEQFRIEEVKYTYTPLFNTFQETGTTSPSVPSIYIAMDRLQSLAPTTTTLTDLVQMGATRQKFVKPFIVKYRPNTMITTGVAQPSGATTQTLQINGADYGRWFPCVTQNVGGTNANTPNTLSAFNQLYYGHWLYIEQLLNPGAASASVAIQVRVSFKNPLINENTSGLENTPYVYSPAHGPTATPILRVIGGAD